MPLDGISANFLAEELREALVGARIDKVQQPSRSDIILSVRNHGRNRKLILSANPSQPRIHFTTENREMPAIAPRFCMLLRKYLVGSRIEQLDTEGYDRVFIFHIASQDEIGDRSVRRLILEVMGRYSNLIFLSPDNIILDAISHVDSAMSRVREVMPARPFVPAPAQNKLEPAEALKAIQGGGFWPSPGSESGNNKLEYYLMDSIQGVSPQLARDVLEQAGVDSRHSYFSLSQGEKEKLSSTLAGLLANVLAGIGEPSLFYQGNTKAPTDFHALPLISLGRRESRPTLSDAMAEYYEMREQHNAYLQRLKYLEKQLNQARSKLRKKRDIHARDVESSRNYDHYRQQGDILMSNMHKVKEGDEELTAVNFYDPDMKEITIPLNPHRSPSWNGQHIYKLYTKNKSRFEQASAFLKKDEAELDWMESLSNQLQHADSMEDLALIRDEMRQGNIIETSGPKQGGGRPVDSFRSRKQARRQGVSKVTDSSASLPLRKYESSDGFTILVGRNNIQNDRLTLRIAHKEDVWLHVQKAAGTHVVIRSAGRDIPDRTLEEAAETAAWFSRSGKVSRESGQVGAKLAVDYCPVSHVRKPSGARPGMVIYDNYQTLMAEPKDPARLVPNESNPEGTDPS